MVRGRVQRREVIVVGLDLGTMHHRVTQTEKHLGDLVGDRVDEMARAHLLHASGKRHVDSRRVDRRRELSRIELRLGRPERLLDGDTRLVDGLADRRPLLLGNLAHRAQIPRQRAGFPEHRHADRLELRRRLGCFDIGER